MSPVITISARAIILREGRLLAITLKYPDGIAHITPGGTQQHGESLHTCLRRECLEEIGTEVEIGRVRFVREYIGKNHQYRDEDGDFHHHEVLFACKVPDDYAPRLGTTPDGYQVGARWLAFDDFEAERLMPVTLGQALKRGLQAPIYLGDVNRAD